MARKPTHVPLDVNSGVSRRAPLISNTRQSGSLGRTRSRTGRVAQNPPNRSPPNYCDIDDGRLPALTWRHSTSSMASSNWAMERSAPQSESSPKSVPSGRRSAQCEAISARATTSIQDAACVCQILADSASKQSSSAFKRSSAAMAAGSFGVSSRVPTRLAAALMSGPSCRNR
jgi:hypothetical protein